MLVDGKNVFNGAFDRIMGRFWLQFGSKRAEAIAAASRRSGWPAATASGSLAVLHVGLYDHAGLAKRLGSYAAVVPHWQRVLRIVSECISAEDVLGKCSLRSSSRVVVTFSSSSLIDGDATSSVSPIVRAITCALRVADQFESLRMEMLHNKGEQIDEVAGLLRLRMAAVAADGHTSALIPHGDEECPPEVVTQYERPAFADVLCSDLYDLAEEATLANLLRGCPSSSLRGPPSMLDLALNSPTRSSRIFADVSACLSDNGSLESIQTELSRRVTGARIEKLPTMARTFRTGRREVVFVTYATGCAGQFFTE